MPRPAPPLLQSGVVSAPGQGETIEHHFGHLAMDVPQVGGVNVWRRCEAGAGGRLLAQHCSS